MKVVLQCRLILVDDFHTMHFIYLGDSRAILERKLSSFYGSKPYICENGLHGFKAKPVKNVPVHTSEGPLDPLSGDLCGMNLEITVVPRKYNFANRAGVRLQIVNILEK